MYIGSKYIALHQKDLSLSLYLSLQPTGRSTVLIEVVCFPNKCACSILGTEEEEEKEREEVEEEREEEEQRKPVVWGEIKRRRGR